MTFLNIVIDKFNNSPFSCYIYSVEFCLKEFATDQELYTVFQEALDVISERCIRFLTSLEAAVNHPTVVEDIFAIWNRCLRINPNLAFNSKQLEEFLLVMTKCIGLEH